MSALVNKLIQFIEYADEKAVCAAAGRSVEQSYYIVPQGEAAI